MEHVPFAAILLAGTFIRIAALGAAPLTSAEAAASWAAWNAAAGEATAWARLPAPPESAALVGLQTALFWLLSGGDLIARLAPALAGSLVVLVPWVARGALGGTESIVLAALLASDPVFIGFSRLADGTAIGVAAAWTAIVCARVAKGSDTSDGRRRAEHLMWIAAGVAAVSGRVFWDLLPALIIVLMMSLGAKMPTLGRRGAALAAAAAVIVTSSGLTQWSGPQFFSVGLSGWMQQWSASSGVSSVEWWSTIARLEAAPLTLGAGSLVLGMFVPARRRLIAVLTMCVLWGVVLTSRPGRTMGSWFALQLPLFLAISAAAPFLVARVSGLRVASPRVAIAATAFVGVLVLHMVSAAVALAADNGSQGFSAHADRTFPAVRDLVQDIQVWRRQSHTGVTLLEVASPPGVDPVLAWYLRHDRNVRWVDSPSLLQGTGRPVQLAIVEAGTREDRHSAAYPIRQQRGVVQQVIVR